MVSANDVTQAGWVARPTLRQLTQDTPHAGAGPAFDATTGAHPLAHATTTARPTLRMLTEDSPQLGGPASFELGPKSRDAFENFTSSDRKEIGTFNRMAGPDRHHAFPNNQSINIRLRPDDCNDFTRTANLEVAQYSNMRSMPNIQVPTSKYSDETACYWNNPINTVTLQNNPFVTDVRQAFTAH
jgi:hypothetical protein